MQQYQWLLFDADGTLFDYDRAESAALRQVFGLFGETFEPAWQAVFQRVNQALWHGVEKGEVTPDMVKVRRFELLLPEIGLGHSPAAFSARYLECLASCAELIRPTTSPSRHEQLRLSIGKRPARWRWMPTHRGGRWLLRGCPG